MPLNRKKTRSRWRLKVRVCAALFGRAFQVDGPTCPKARLRRLTSAEPAVDRGLQIGRVCDPALQVSCNCTATHQSLQFFNVPTAIRFILAPQWSYQNSIDYARRNSSHVIDTGHRTDGHEDNSYELFIWIPKQTSDAYRIQLENTQTTYHKVNLL